MFVALPNVYVLDTLGIKLLVTLDVTFKLPTLAVLVTFKLLDTFIKLAIPKLPKLALRAEILPLKLAVLPCKSSTILALPLTCKLLETFTKLAVAKLPKLALAAVKLPLKLPILPFK